MRIQKLFNSFLVFFVLISGPNLVFSQDNPEPEIKSKADKAFKNENYVEASKLYAHLLTFNQSDPYYNYRYGISLLYNSRKKADAIKHLTFASKVENFDPEVFYYLGKAYHLDYNFNQAIANYNVYKSKVGTKTNPDLQVDQQINMSENGKRLLSVNNEVVVLDKQEIETKNFFRIYDLSDIGGNMVVTAQFQSKIDKKRNHVPLIHFPSNPKRIFYSSYGTEEATGKDIYMCQRLPDGSWSLAQKVNGGINTDFDEDYPYFHPKGDYLYFCSKGHNSMGGFDIFRSKYDPETNSFGEPENIDFPISSPDNDLLYIVDSLEENAYFSSARQSLDDKIHVYKVKVEKIPIQFVAIKSDFISKINPDNKKVSVEIFDFSVNKKIGRYNSTSKGSILFTFPKGGKYEYIVKVEGSDKEFKEIIAVPFLKVFRPLKQRFIHEKNAEGEEVLTIINLFDEDLEDSYDVMMDIAKMRSELTPNADQFDAELLETTASNKEAYSKLGMAKLNDSEVIQKLEDLVDNQEKKIEDLEKIMDNSVNQSVENIKTISTLQEDLKLTVATANNKIGEERKHEFEEAGKMVNELNFLEDYVEKLLETADSLNRIIEKSKSDIQKYNDIVEELKRIYSTGDLKEFGKKLSEDLNSLLALQKENPEFVTASLRSQILIQKDLMDKVEAKIKDLNEQIATGEAEVNQLKKEVGKSKDKEKAKKQVDDKIYENNLLKESLKTQNDKLVETNNKIVMLESRLGYFQDILNSTAPATTSSSADVFRALKSSNNQNTRTLKTYVEQQLKELGVDMHTLKSPSELKKMENKPASVAKNLPPKNNGTQNPNGETANATAGNNTSNNNASNNSTKSAAQNSDTAKTGANTSDSAKSGNTSDTKTNSSNSEAGANGTSSGKENTASANNAESANTKDSETASKLADDSKKTNETNSESNTAGEQNSALKTAEKGNSEEPKNSLAATLTKDYVKNKTAINESTTLTGDEKQLAIFRQAKIMKYSLGKEIELLESKAQNQPNSTQFAEDIKALKEELSVVSKELEDQEKNIKNKFPDSVRVANLTVGKVTEMLSPKHDATVSKIDVNKGISDVSKAKLGIKEDEKLLLLAKKDRARLFQESVSDPKNQYIKSEIKIVETVIKETEDRLDKNNLLVSTYKVNQTLNNLNSGLLEGENVKVEKDLENSYLSEMRNKELKGNLSVLEDQSNTNSEALEKQTDALNNYITSLSDRQYELEEKLAKNPSQLDLITELAIINKEIDNVRKKMDEVEYKIDDTDQKEMAEKYIQLNDDVSNLKQQENDISIALKDPSTPKKDKAQLNAQLLENQTNQAETYEKINKLQVTLIKKYPPNKIRNKRMAKLSQNVMDSLLYDRFLRNDSIIKGQLETVKNSGGSKKAKVLPELLKEQEENSIIAQQILYNSQMKKHLRQVGKYGNMYTLQSTNTLEKTKVNLKYNQEGAEQKLTAEKINLAKAKKKKKPIFVKKVETYNKELEVLEKLQKDLEVEFAKRELFMKEFREQEKTPLEISEEERKKILENGQYEELKDLYVQKKMTFEGMKLLIDNLEKAKDNYNQAILDFSNDPVKSNKQFANRMFEALKNVYKQYYELESNYVKLNETYRAKTSSISELNKFEQIFDEAYEKEVALITAKALEKKMELANEGGFNFSTKPLENKLNDAAANLATLDEEKINFSNEIPEKGVFVQLYIGDLDQPLMSNVFLKFDNINAELLSNGKTAYYSDNLTDYSQIDGAVYYLKNLGYSNAKVMAYQDGQLTSFAELKKEQEKEKVRQDLLAQQSNSKNTKTSKSGKGSKPGDAVTTKQDVAAQQSSGKNDTMDRKTEKTSTDNTWSAVTENKTDSGKTAEGTQKANTEAMNSGTENRNNGTNPSLTTSTKADPATKVGKTNGTAKSSKTGSSFENLINATPIETKQGLFFTVQVGAFMNKKFPTNLKDIQQVFSKKFADGVIRYSTGIFHSVEEARALKNQVISMGVTDAFITAYYKGERITVAEAERLLSEGGAVLLEAK